VYRTYVRCSRPLLVGALLASSIAAAQPAAQPAAPPAAPPPSVPLLVVDAPATFDVARLESALATYVPTATLAVTTTAGSPAGCEEALAAARAAGSPMALWLHWNATGGIEIERVGEAGCTAVESSTVDVPPAQPAFVYRVVALKVASLVRELRAPEPPPEPAVPGPTPTPPAVDVVATKPIDDAGPSRSIELGVSGVAHTTAESRVYAATAGAWFGHTWALGGDVHVGLARDATAAGGRGSVRAFGAFAGIRRAIVVRPAWSIDVALQLGAIGVHGSATRTNDASAMSADVWTPAAALAPRLRVAAFGPLSFSLGPTLELLARPVDLRLGVSPLYHSGRVRVRGELRAEIAF
jgi:hypothetical protein